MKQGKQELRVDLRDENGNTAYAKYNTFSIESAGNGYQLSVGGYSDTAGEYNIPI